MASLPLPILPSSRDAAMVDLNHAARIMKISTSKARLLAAQGKLPVPAVKVGSTWRIAYMPLITALGIAPSPQH
jgi:hypothetical protein